MDFHFSFLDSSNYKTTFPLISYWFGFYLQTLTYSRIVLCLAISNLLKQIAIKFRPLFHFISFFFFIARHCFCIHLFFFIYIGTFPATRIWRKISYWAWSRYWKIYRRIGAESWSIAGCGLHWECNKEGNCTVLPFWELLLLIHTHTYTTHLSWSNLNHS